VIGIILVCVQIRLTFGGWTFRNAHHLIFGCRATWLWSKVAEFLTTRFIAHSEFGVNKTVKWALSYHSHTPEKTSKGTKTCVSLCTNWIKTGMHIIHATNHGLMKVQQIKRTSYTSNYIVCVLPPRQRFPISLRLAYDPLFLTIKEASTISNIQHRNFYPPSNTSVSGRSVFQISNLNLWGIFTKTVQTNEGRPKAIIFYLLKSATRWQAI